MNKTIKNISLCVALAVFCIYPASAQLTVAKRVFRATDFNTNLLPSITKWTLGAGAAFDNNNTTIKLTNTNGQECLAYYSFNLNQKTAKPIRISGESYSRNVTFMSPSLLYALRVDVTYNDSSTELYSCIPFAGKPTWESKDFIFCPKKPIKHVLVMAMLYKYSGTAWFRNIRLQENIGAKSSFGRFADTVISNQTTTEGYLIKQFANTENWYEIKNGQAGLNWSFAATRGTAGNFTTHTATITNTGTSGRAGILAYRIPVTGSNLRWCGADMRTRISMNSLNAEYSDERLTFTNAKSRPPLLWGCVVSDTTGYAIAVDPDYPCQFKIHYSACNQEFFIMFDLGFTPAGSARASATVKFVTWKFNPAAGMRQAVHDYYMLYPNAFHDRIVEHGEEHGIWWFQRPHFATSIPNMKDFGFKLDQQPPDNIIPYDDANDFLSTLYVAPWELRIYGADLPGWPNPAYADVVRRLNNLYKAGNPAAVAVVNSAAKDSTGKYKYLTTVEWSSKFIRFQCNPAPGIRPNIADASALSERNAYYDQWENPSMQARLTAPNTWDGVMCDNVANNYLELCSDKTAIDYSSSHFNCMATPLVHDKNGAVGIGLEMMIWEYFNGVRQGMDKLMAGDNRLRVIQANGVPPPFVGCKLDILSGEQVWDRDNEWSPPPEAAMLEYRMKAGRKPVVFMHHPYEHSLGPGSNWMADARTQKYFARCCAFGFMPSFGITDAGASSAGLMYFEKPAFFETPNPNTTPPNMSDRNLFQKYIPVIRKLSQAGWEPLRRASVNSSEVFIERFGAEYLTVFNPMAASRTITVTYQPTAINITGKELISGNNVTWTDGRATLTLGPECVAVLEIPALLNFKFDEGSGSGVVTAPPYADITGTSFNASRVNGVDGQSAHALSFNGITSYVNIPNDNLFAVSDDGVTFAAWIKPGALSSSHNMVLSHGSGHFLSLYNGYVFFNIITKDGAQHWCSSAAALTANAWYHIAGSYDREGNMKIFINGRQSGNAARPFFNPSGNANSLDIGKNFSTGLYYFNGIMDDVQICRRGCTDKEIRKLKDSAIIAYSLPLNDGAGNIAHDDFERTRRATITGATWHGNTKLDQKDNALYFDGINDYAEITGSGAAFRTDGSNGFTLAAWIKADGAFHAKHSPIISRGGTFLSIYGGKLGFKTLTDYPANNQRWCGGAATVTPDAWHHVAAVYDTNGNMKVYLDGALDGSASGPYPNQINEPANIRIGTWGSFFKGIISNVRIYKRGLTGDEINLLYRNKE